MNNFIIRAYKQDDFNEVIELWSQCGLIVPQNNPKLDIERKLKVNPEWFLVGQLDDRVIATCMAGYEGHRGWIAYAKRPETKNRRIIESIALLEQGKKLGMK